MKTTKTHDADDLRRIVATKAMELKPLGSTVTSRVPFSDHTPYQALRTKEDLMQSQAKPSLSNHDIERIRSAFSGSEVPKPGEDDEDAELTVDENSSTRERLYVLLMQSFPVIASFFLNVGGTFVNLIFASHFVHERGGQSTVFAGVSLANMFANVSCLSLLLGMSSAVETLGSQHNGAKNYDEVGIVLWRCMMILGLMLIPIAIVWYFSGAIFHSLGVDEVVCEVINNYLHIHILTMPIDVVAVSYEKYLMSIGVMRPSMWSQIVFNVSLFTLNMIFVYGFHMDYQCLAWSWVISIYLAAVVQLVLSWNHPWVQRTLRPWTTATLSNWDIFISLGLPSTIMMCSEWWAYEILVIFASILGTEDVAAQTIILQSSSLAFMIPCGLGVAATSLVGNALGAHKLQLAIQLSRMSLFVILFLELLVGTSVYLWGANFIDLCTPDEVVRRMAKSTLPFLSVFTIVDGLQGVATGILRGAGRQSVGAVLNVVAFYVIGLPMAYILCFKTNLGVNGLVSGISIGAAFQVSVLLFLIIFRENYVFSTELVIEQKRKYSIGSSCSPSPQVVIRKRMGEGNNKAGQPQGGGNQKAPRSTLFTAAGSSNTTSYGSGAGVAGSSDPPPPPPPPPLPYELNTV